MHPLVQEQLEQMLAFKLNQLADLELHEAELQHHLAQDQKHIEDTRALVNAVRFELAGGQPVEASSHGSLGLGKLLGGVVVGGVAAEDEPIDLVPTDIVDAELELGDKPVVTGLSFGAPNVDPDTTDHQPVIEPSILAAFAGDLDQSDYFDAEGGCADCHVRPGMLHLNDCAVEARFRGGA